MRSQNIQYISRIDHLRFFAFFMVFYMHHIFWFPTERIKDLNFNGHIFDFKEILKLWVANGTTGVSLFLVLSGFLFCLIAGGGEKKIRYLPFIYNRILRIFPLLVFFIFIIITVNRVESGPEAIFRLLTLQLNTGNPTTGWGHTDNFPTGPIWTIAVEFQFYLIFPVIISFAKQHGIRWLLLVILLMIVTRILITGNNNNVNFWFYLNIYYTIIGRLDQFIIGIIAGIIYLTKKDFLSKIHEQIAIVAMCFILFTIVFTIPVATWFGTCFRFTAEGTLWSLIIIVYLKFPFPDIQKLDSFLSWLGSMSFSMYLFHVSVATFFVKTFSMAYPETFNSLLAQNTIILPGVVLFSILTFYAIEKPFFERRVKYIVNEKEPPASMRE